jgi:hypothetical protein
MPDAMSLYARPEELATTVPLNAKLDHILIFFTEHLAGGDNTRPSSWIRKSRSLAALLG